MKNLNSKQKTLRTSVSDLFFHEPPHYYMLRLPNGTTRCCGTASDVVRVMEMYPNASVEKIVPPAPPETVTITAQTLGREQALNEGAKQLPESESIKLEL